jgi:hypothetical protein
MVKEPQIPSDEQFDKNHYVLEDDEFKAFEEALNAAPESTDIIKALKMQPSPWKR